MSKRSKEKSVIITLMILSSILVTLLLPTINADYDKTELLVRFKSGIGKFEEETVLRNTGFEVLDEIPQLKLHVIRVPSVSVNNVISALSNNPVIEFVEVNAMLQLSKVPNDYYYGSEWHLRKIQSDLSWNLSTGKSSIVIAILDTGVDSSHSDLSSILVPGYNFYDNNYDTSDVHGHGTQVAGVAAAVTNNVIGVSSVSWGCSIMPLRVADPNGYAYFSTISKAIVYAADKGARVASISFQINSAQSLTTAAQYMTNMGGVVIAAGGNTGTYISEADNPYIISVSATGTSDTLASFSTKGPFIDLSAPGVGLYTTRLGGGYGSASGTSFSAPLTAGLVGLMLSANPSLSSSQVESILESTAVDLGSSGYDTSYGWGRINAYEALKRCVSTKTVTDLEVPTVKITNPVPDSIVSSTMTVTLSASDNVGIKKTELYLDNVLVGSDTVSPYEYSIDTTQYLDGTHSLSAKAEDTSGNIATSAQVSVEFKNFVDSTPPTVSILQPKTGEIVSQTISVLVSASDNTGIEKIELYMNGGLFGTSINSSYEFQVDTTKYADGKYVFLSKAVDLSGNTASSEEVYLTFSNLPPADTTPPSVSIMEPTDGQIVSGDIIIKINASDNVAVSTIELYVDKKLAGSLTTLPYEFILNTAQYADGSHVLLAKAYDAAGNSASSSITVTVKNIQEEKDTTPPTVTILEPTNGSTLSGEVLIKINAADNVEVSKIELYIDDTITGAINSAYYEYRWNTAQYADGSHVLLAKAYDAAGNSASSSITVTVKNVQLEQDTTSPMITLKSPADGETVSGFVIIKVDAYDDTGIRVVEFYIDGEIKSVDSSPEYSYKWQTRSVKTGWHTIKVVAISVSGLTTEIQISVYVANKK